ncbi:nucleotidyltransferase family protein [Neobacillus sp. PS3-40]|uniref:nucleotidyltransferase family protein n=1 Tax=Neobacillus sp. PS3-40 TaxID=3070679 RepID=UPI0027E160E8|nr:nucleotidyltransferase family protein [Neobacillus sp. PS3-40]WML42800.1 nucleotidyltransferase family protein [Neobacillus sp. PS3-40]
MKLVNEEDFIREIKKDEWMIQILTTVKSLNLPDWWICAGFVRSKIWDLIHDFDSRTPLSDIDVIFFDKKNTNEVTEKKIEEKLKVLMYDVPWSVKNQARMHIKSNLPPYSSSVDGISKFPETVTALGVKVDEKNNVILTAPWGVQDVLNLEVKPTPYFLEGKEQAEIYKNRVVNKNWKAVWPRVKIYNMDY